MAGSASGAAQFYALSKRLKAAGEKDLRRELNKGVRRAGKPLVAVARAGFVAGLPKRGGVNEFIAGKRITIVPRTGVRTYGIGVKVNKQDPRLDTEGRLAHPVFDRRHAEQNKKGVIRRVFVVQKVKSAVFSDALAAGAPDLVREEIIRAVEDVERMVAGRF